MSRIVKPFEEERGITRRYLLSGAGKFAAGMAVASAAGAGIVRVAGAKEQRFPWPYVKLDPAEVAEVAYENWYRHFCAYASISGIIQPLKQKVGEPYTSLPLAAFEWGHGGGVGWGMTCGTLMGSGMAAAFVAGKDGEKIINDVIAWYASTELPTFRPKNPKASFKNINASNSPLCHVSVGKWMKKEGVKFFSPERRDRCARLSAQVSAKTAELLNLWADGKYTTVHGSQASTYDITAQNNCAECHGG